MIMSSIGIVDVWFYWWNNGTARRIKSPRLIGHSYSQIAISIDLQNSSYSTKGLRQMWN